MEKNLTIVFLILIFNRLKIPGSTYFVSPDGSNSNTGSFKTLEYGEKQVNAGDIIYLKGGTPKIGYTNPDLNNCIYHFSLQQVKKYRISGL